MSTRFGDAPAPDAALTDHALALALATAAGRRLLQVREELAGAGAHTLKAAGDRASQEVLARLLAQTRPQDPVLSEEAADDRNRLDSDRVWIIDPLDGTREFSEAGRADWAVHVALWERGELTVGAVTRPAAGLAFGTGEPPTPAAAHEGPVRIAVSRSRPPAFGTELAERTGSVLVPMGSAGVKATAMFSGEADLYLHAGGQYEWDSAAPVAVALAAGLHATRLDGSPLRYNQPDPYLPDLVIGQPWVLARVGKVLPDRLP